MSVPIYDRLEAGAAGLLLFSPSPKRIGSPRPLTSWSLMLPDIKRKTLHAHLSSHGLRDTCALGRAICIPEGMRKVGNISDLLRKSSLAFYTETPLVYNAPALTITTTLVEPAIPDRARRRSFARCWRAASPCLLARFLVGNGA